MKRVEAAGAQPLRIYLLDAVRHALIDWNEVSLALLVCSTAGDGALPAAAGEFFASLAKPGLDLSDVRYSTLALGDSSYPNFCAAGKKLDALMRERGARAVVERVDVDAENPDAIEGWLEAVGACVIDELFWKRVRAAREPDRLRERAARPLDPVQPGDTE